MNNVPGSVHENAESLDCDVIHRNGNVVIFLTAPEVVNMTTSRAASNFSFSVVVINCTLICACDAITRQIW